MVFTFTFKPRFLYAKSDVYVECKEMVVFGERSMWIIKRCSCSLYLEKWSKPTTNSRLAEAACVRANPEFTEGGGVIYKMPIRLFPRAENITRVVVS